MCIETEDSLTRLCDRQIVKIKELTKQIDSLLNAAEWGLKIAFDSCMDDTDIAVQEIKKAIAKAKKAK